MASPVSAEEIKPSMSGKKIKQVAMRKFRKVGRFFFPLTLFLMRGVDFLTVGFFAVVFLAVGFLLVFLVEVFLGIFKTPYGYDYSIRAHFYARIIV